MTRLRLLTVLTALALCIGAMACGEDDDSPTPTDTGGTSDAALDTSTSDAGGGDTGNACFAAGSPLPEGHSRCDNDSEKVFSCSSGVLGSGPCPDGTTCEQVSESEADCACLDEMDGACPATCPNDPDC